MAECVLGKSRLLKLLDAVDLLERQGSSPYVGVHISKDSSQCQLYRSGVEGCIKTVGAPRVDDPNIPWAFVSMSHLRACINVLPTDSVKLWVFKGPSGPPILYVGEVSDTYSSELRVASTGFNRTGMKTHDVGTVKDTIPHDWFTGFHYPQGLKLVVPPLLSEDMILLLSSDGGVRFTGLCPLDLTSSPRATLLRAIDDYPSQEISVTTLGYYTMKTDDLEFSIVGHTVDTKVVANFVGDKPLGDLSTPRLLVALYACSRLSDNNAIVQLDLKAGVISTEGEFGNPIKFFVDKGVDVQTKVTKKAAALIHDALKNSTSPTTQVYIKANKNQTRTIIFESGRWVGSSVIA